MKMLLLHGRYNPDQDMDEIGFQGPTLTDIKYIHATYQSLNIGFVSEQAAQQAHTLTHWDLLDKMVLQAAHADDMLKVIEKNTAPSYYGDWELQQEEAAP
jgi:hypothetical protein